MPGRGPSGLKLGSNSGPAVDTLYQIQVYYNLDVFKKGFFLKKLFKKDPPLFIPFVCTNVFLNKKDAEDFTPTYVDYLIKEEVIDGNVLYDDKGQLNSNAISIVIVPLTILSSIEDNDDDDGIKEILKGI
jgi:hypothetical protein